MSLFRLRGRLFMQPIN